MNKRVFFILLTLPFLSAIEFKAAGLTPTEAIIPHEFKAGEVAKASEVNANFQALKEAIDLLFDAQLQLLQQEITERTATERSLQSLEQENQALKDSIAELKTRIETLENRPSVPSTSFPARLLRSNSLTVSEEEFTIVFKLDKDRRPLEYIENDFEYQGEVIVDHATWLTWQKAGSETSLTYDQAKTYVEELNRQTFGGYDDWRLPTIPELMSLLESEKQNKDLYINPLFDATQHRCWSADMRSSESAWRVHFGDGLVIWSVLEDHYFVRAVRSSLSSKIPWK